MAEFEDSFSERMAQLEQEDLERYHRDIMRNSSCSYVDETPNHLDEYESKLILLLDLVCGFLNDFPQTTSSTENGSEPPTMNPQPLNFLDDVASCSHSDLGSETTDELHSDEGSMVNELPDAAEMMGFNGNQGNESSTSDIVTDLEEYKVSESPIDSYFLVNPSHQKQLTSMDSGFKVLSIYCAHMATKWRPVLDSQPLQGNDMSVEDYYDHFFNWKRKLEVVNYIGGEESYVDDFIFGLKNELAVRVWGYKCKPHTLYGAFCRALIEENMMKNVADRLLEERPHSTSIGIQGAKYVLDKNVNVVLDASGLLDVKLQLDLSAESMFLQSGKWGQYCKDATLKIMVGEIVFFMFDPGGCPLSNLKLCEQSTLIELNEREKVHGGVVLSVTNLQVALGPLGDKKVNSSDNGSTKAFNVSGNYVIEHGAYKVFGEITQVIRADLLDNEVMNHSAKYADFNKLILFDPGPSRKCVLSFSRKAARLLFGKAHGMVVWSFEGVTSIHRHANSFLNTSHRNSLLTLFHDMDKCTAAMMILGALKCLEGEMIHLYVFTHLEDSPAGLSIQRAHFKLVGRALLTRAYIEHIAYAYTLLGNNLSYQNEVVQRITHKNFHLEQLHVALMNKIRVPNVTEVSHLSEMFGATKYYSKLFDPGTEANVVQMNLQCIVAFFVEILAHSVRCRLFDPGGNLLSHLEGNILKSDAFSSVLVIIQREVFFIFVWGTGQCALIDYILEDKDVFERVGKWLILMDHRTELLVTEPNVDFAQIEVLVTHLMKFAQLPSFPESSKLTGWSNVLSYLHNFVNIGLVRRGNYVYDCFQATLCSNILMNGAEWNLKIEQCWSTWNMIRETNMLRVSTEDLLGQDIGTKHFQPHLSTCSYVGTDVTKFFKVVLFPSISDWVLGNVLNMDNGGCEELCFAAMDETIENSLKPLVEDCNKKGNVQVMLMIWEVWYNICTLFYCSCFMSMGEIFHVLSTPNFNSHGNQKYLGMVEYIYSPECNVSSVIPTFFGDTHSSCLVEYSKDYVANITPLYFDEAWSIVRIGNNEKPWSFANYSKTTFFWVELSYIFDHVASQMAQMLCLIGYNGFYYDLGSYTIIALENSCLMNSYPNSVVVHTNLVQGAAISKMLYGILVFVFRPP